MRSAATGRAYIDENLLFADVCDHVIGIIKAL
jgi:hypothetical protein